MRKKYKNEIFNLIKEKGYSPNDFNYTGEINSIGQSSFVIEYKKTDLKFIFRNPDDSYEDFDYSYTPFSKKPTLSKFQPPKKWVDFLTTISRFDIWIDEVIGEYLDEESEIDLWENYKNGNASFDFDKTEFDDQSNFTVDEKLQLKMSLNELKLLIKENLNTTPGQQKLIDDRLDYLVEAMNRLNKFDWKSVAISTVISISISLTLDTERGKLLFELFKRVFKIFAHIPLLN